MDTWYDLIGLIVSVGIIMFYSVALSYNVKLRNVTQVEAWQVSRRLQFHIYMVWIVIFSAVGISIMIGKPFIIAESFGALVIRPVILINAVISAVTMRQTYYERITLGLKNG